MSRSRIALSLAALYLAACRPSAPDPSSMSSADSARVIREVERATWAFHAADTAMNAEGVIALLWPEYTMLVDGQRLAWSEVAAGSRAFMASLALFHSEWTDLVVIPLGRDAAVSAFRFRDSIVASSGELTRSQGTTSFVWQRRGDEWRILYADATHRPPTP